MPELTILSSNCFGSPISLNRKKRMVVIAEEIEKLNPDIVMLQEVVTRHTSELLDLELKKYGWHGYNTPGLIFRKGGLAMYSKKHKLERHTFHPFLNQGPVISWSLADRMVGKGFQTTTLRLKDRDLLLINTHITCNYSKKVTEIDFQRQQLAQLRKFVKTTSFTNIILGGDLSMQPNSQDIEALISERSLKDTLPKEAVTVSPEYSKKNVILKMFGSDNPVRVDYILVSQVIKVVSSRVVFNKAKVIDGRSTQLSDHFGIYVKLGIG